MSEKNYRLLIVENEKDSLINISQNKFLIETVKNGAEGMGIWDKFQPHLVCALGFSSVMSGLEFLGWIREKNKIEGPFVPVFLWFWEKKPWIIAKAVELGVSEIFQKKVEFEEFFKISQKHLIELTEDSLRNILETFHISTVSDLPPWKKTGFQDFITIWNNYLLCVWVPQGKKPSDYKNASHGKFFEEVICWFKPGLTWMPLWPKKNFMKDNVMDSFQEASRVEGFHIFEKNKKRFIAFE